jgi:hypothetical protein
LKSWLLVPVMLVVTYVPWPGLVFLLADSGLYQDVVDEGCEVEHGGKRADKGEGQRADGGDAGSVGQRRGERGGGCNPCLHLTVCGVFSTILYLFFTDCRIIFHGFSKILYLFFTGLLRVFSPFFTDFKRLHYPCSTGLLTDC